MSYNIVRLYEEHVYDDEYFFIIKIKMKITKFVFVFLMTCLSIPVLRTFLPTSLRGKKFSFCSSILTIRLISRTFQGKTKRSRDMQKPKFFNQFLKLLILTVYAAVSLLIFNRVYETSKEVIDELFHIDQGVKYCHGNFSEVS